MISKEFNLFVLAAISALLLIVPISNSEAEIKAGVRAGGYFDPDSASIGAEILTNLNREHTLFFNPNVEFVFLDNADLWTFNMDFHYDVLPQDAPLYLWFGGGPAVLYRNPEAPLANDDTDLGANIFGGVGFRIRGTDLVPYIQPKYTFADNDRFSLALGLRF